MTKTIELELKDFPDDVREVLRQRAIERCVGISVVIREYVVETSRLIKASQEAA